MGGKEPRISFSCQRAFSKETQSQPADGGAQSCIWMLPGASHPGAHLGGHKKETKVNAGDAKAGNPGESPEKKAWMHAVFSTVSQAVVLALTRSSDGRDRDVTAVHSHPVKPWL